MEVAVDETQQNHESLRIAVTGATGFIGEAFIKQLVETTDHTVFALSRSRRNYNHERVIGKKVDFFSLRESEEALADCDVGIYLLHSMSPSNRLSQGSFEDFDFILADNFARAAKVNGLKQIIYVGGIVDENKRNLSRHLRSRLEVEDTLRSYGVPVTALRSSLVIGAKGSSFIILKKLVSRLPSMTLPSWVRTQCQPIYVDDLVQIMRSCVNNSKVFSRTFDCGHPDVMTYRDLIVLTAKHLRVKRKLIDLPYIPLALSKLWVRLVTGASKSLVYPLVDSLDMAMVNSEERQLCQSITPSFTSIDDAIKESVQVKLSQKRVLTSKPTAQVKERNEVKSVQRLPLPEGYDAYHIAKWYFKWLPRFFTRIITVHNFGKKSNFYLFSYYKPMLSLVFLPSRSTPERQVFLITGGLLAKPSSKGRLEFREDPGGKFVFAAIHDYRPRLPWWIYRISQAVVHKFVMWSFGKFLGRVDERKKGALISAERI